MSKPTPPTRSHETEILLPATPEEVWKALTDPAELVNWFPLAAEVEPGEGGSIRYSWGPELSGLCRIEAWDPPRHLRTGWMVHPPGDAAAPQVAVDYRLEARGGTTVLRLVHSGFGTGPEWDKEYDGTWRGWKQELRSLRLYLKHHLGRKRRMIWARAPIGMPEPQAWRRLMGTDGLVREGRLEELSEGDRFAIRTAGGDALQGTVVLYAPPKDFAGVVENLGHSYLRATIEDCFGAVEAQIWLSTWSLPEEQAEGLEKRLGNLLANLFPAEPGLEPPRESW